uniref:Uncharacterized protein n=1 Tax=Opuntia streptacantha TaxID=393608 RepID=A0A7C8YJ71_OPUST
MEGLIPYLYKAIVHQKTGVEGPIGSWLNPSSSPSASYARLPSGESGRFQFGSDISLFRSDNQGLSPKKKSTTEVVLSTGSRSPSQWVVSRQRVNVSDPPVVVMH